MTWRRMRRGIAHHEAGHAVVAHHHGFEVTRVEIDARERCSILGPRGLDGVDFAMIDCHIAVAGRLAQRRLPRSRRGYSLSDECLRGFLAGDLLADAALGPPEDLSDEVVVLSRLRSWLGDDAREIIGAYRRFEAGTDETLDGAWPAVVALAGALLKGGDMDGDAARRVMDEALS